MILYLASASERRAQLLSQWGIPFTVIPNLLETEILPYSGTNRHIQGALKRLASSKAFVSKSHYSGVILSADTVIVHRRNVFGKPRSIQEAQAMLTRLSGDRHRVMTSVALYHTGFCRSWTFCVTATVYFNILSSDDIAHYCSHHSVLDKAGSYAIQDIGHAFVRHMDGDYSTVIGLPEHPLRRYLRNFGI